MELVIRFVTSGAGIRVRKDTGRGLTIQDVGGFNDRKGVDMFQDCLQVQRMLSWIFS